MADQTPITRAAAAIEGTIRSHVVPSVVVPGIAAPFIGATMSELARAAFDSIDVHELAQALALDGELACFDREALGESYGLRVWESDRDHYRTTAEAVKAHLTSPTALAAGDE